MIGCLGYRGVAGVAAFGKISIHTCAFLKQRSVYTYVCLFPLLACNQSKFIARPLSCIVELYSCVHLFQVVEGIAPNFIIL